MITAHEVLGLILGDAGRIANAISTGAAWEIWMQVELAVLFRERGLGVARELPYPPPNQNLHLDLSVQDKEGQRYAFELKVESAQHGTPGAMLSALNNDVEKILLYNTENLVARDVIGIAYSAPVKAALEQLAEDNKGSVIYGVSHGVGVVLIDANTFSLSSDDSSPGTTDSPPSFSDVPPSPVPLTPTSTASSDCLAQLQSCIEQCEQSAGTDPQQLAECLQGCIQAYLKCQGAA